MAKWRVVKQQGAEGGDFILGRHSIAIKLSEYILMRFLHTPKSESLNAPTEVVTFTGNPNSNIHCNAL